jgi:hypothetical protein
MVDYRMGIIKTTADARFEVLTASLTKVKYLA